MQTMFVKSKFKLQHKYMIETTHIEWVCLRNHFESYVLK